MIFLSIALYGLVHSWLASRSLKAWVEARAGDAARYYRLIYNLIAVVTLLPVLALVALLPDRRLYVVPSPWSLGLFLLQGLALVALAVGVWQTGIGSFTGLRQAIAPETGSSSLVTGGLYRWVRHPLYSAGLLLIWANPGMTANLLAFNIGATAYLYVGAKFEERKLRREFGAAYQRYQQITPMFVPGLKVMRASPLAEP